MVTRQQRYGISDEAYEAQLAEQRGLCEVCRELNPHGKPLGVDHNHITNANRGLLCDRCNKILGFARDSRDLLESLRTYLLKYDGEGSPYVPDNPLTRAARDAAFEASLSPSEQVSETLSVSEQLSLSEVTRGPIQVLGEAALAGPQ
jgi:Recombination endonuclease VII